MKYTMSALVRKSVILSMLLMLCITPLFSRGQAEQPEGEVTIEMWTHDALYIEFFQKRIQQMNESNPDLTIILDAQEMPDPITSFVSAFVAREDLPDIIGIEQGDFPVLMEDDIVEDVLVNLTDRIGDRYDDFVQGRWALYTHNENIYGVESALTAAAYYYQPALFEQHGLEVPGTWEEYFDVGAELAEHGTAIGIMDNDSAGIFSMMFLQRGGQFFDQDGEIILGEGENREHALAVLELLKKGIDDGSLMVVLGNEFWGSTIPSAFTSGRAAGIVAPDWYNMSVLQPGVSGMEGQWRVAPMPVWADGTGYTTSVWGGTGFAITSASDHIDIAWDIIEDGYMTLDGQLDRYETIGFYPTMYEALEDPTITEQEHSFFGNQKIGSIFADVALDTPPLWQSPARPYLLEALVDNLPLFIEGQISADALIDRVVDITIRDSEI